MTDFHASKIQDLNQLLSRLEFGGGLRFAKDNPNSQAFLKVHGLNVKFLRTTASQRSMSLNYLQEVEGVDFYDSFTGGEDVVWYSAKELGLAWPEGGDPMCHHTVQQGLEFVTQRDFVSVCLNSKNRILITDGGHEDGFYNFLRYLVPTLLRKTRRYVFHSSAVLNPDQSASLFLGHSGYGKSTICEKFPESVRLGDDMHVVYIEGLQGMGRAHSSWANSYCMGQSR